MVARINIPVNDNPIFLNDKSMDDFKLFRSSVGEKVGFEQKRVRNFIDAKQKESVLQKLVESFLQAALAYLSHPDFSKKYVLKRYQEFLKKNMGLPIKMGSNDSKPFVMLDDATGEAVTVVLEADRKQRISADPGLPLDQRLESFEDSLFRF